MSTNTLPAQPLTLGGFLRDRRARLLPAPEAASRRRTPGLRREEVATRANVSVTWYTWLEQGRGGPPSDEVLERLARALELDSAGREFMFLLAQQRPPPLKPRSSAEVTPALQRVLDAMPTTPAIVKTASWDIVAWNAAALAVLADYPALEPGERNLLRRLFHTPRVRKGMPDWETDARYAVASFRIDMARAGDCPEATALAAELQATSADFRRLWAENEMRSHWVGTKRIERPGVGAITLEYQALAIDSSPGLSLMVFTPVTAADAEAIGVLMGERVSAGKGLSTCCSRGAAN